MSALLLEISIFISTVHVDNHLKAVILNLLSSDLFKYCICVHLLKADISYPTFRFCLL